MFAHSKSEILFMTYAELKLLWRYQLDKLYDQDECDNLFYLSCYQLNQWGRSRVLFEKDNVLSTDDEKKFSEILHELVLCKPIQYIFGETEFYQLKFKLSPHVLIPRPETEELVDWIVKDYMGKRNIQFLDIGTGSGCIAVSLAKNMIHPQAYAMDISEDALLVASDNAELLHTQVNFMCGDILLMANAQLDEGFDVIVSNPPYIPIAESAAMKKHVTQFEPHTALFVPDENPLIFYHTISDFALLNLQPNGALYFETHENFCEEVSTMLVQKGFSDVIIKKDLHNKTRFVKAIQIAD